ncbi:MAG: glutamine--fructose-6-phosphate transaminase (isomerizing), partial [bacterium]
MCGIVGYLGQKPIVPVLMEGLKRLEYRGYDSAGIVTLSNGSVNLVKQAGKISNLEALLAEHPINGSVGIAHTRWA